MLALALALSSSLASAQDAGAPRSTEPCGPTRRPPPAVAPLPDDTSALRWRVRESATAAAASPAVATACTAQERRAEAARRRVGRALANSEIAEAATDLGVCHHGAGGAWVLEAGVSANRTARIDGSQVRFVEIRWQLAFVTATGALVRSRTPTQPMSSDPRRSRVAFFSAIHDFNRDGVSEAALVVREDAAAIGEPARTTGAVFSVAGGAVAPLPSAAAVRDVSIAYDADGDGAPDFVQRSAFSAANTCGPAIFYGADELAHALPNGAFSMDDAVSREFLRKRCEEFARPPTHFSNGNAGTYSGEIPLRVSCWRHWGVSAEEIARLMRRDWPADDDRCTSRDDVARSLREARPRYQLEQPCTPPRR